MAEIEPLPCIVCKQPLRAAMPGQQNHPMGNVFICRGNYGSTVFDPMDGKYLEVNICDGCLVLSAQQEQVLQGQLTAKQPVLAPWQPPEHSGSRLWLQSQQDQPLEE